MARFVIVIVVAALVIAGGVRAGLHFGWIVTEPTFSSIIIVFLTLTTIIIYYKLIHTSQALFTQFYLLSIAVKMLAYLGFVVFMVLEDRLAAVANVVLFMITYFTFTILEIAFLYGRISAGNDPE